MIHQINRKIHIEWRYVRQIAVIEGNNIKTIRNVLSSGTIARSMTIGDFSHKWVSADIEDSDLSAYALKDVLRWTLNPQ